MSNNYIKYLKTGPVNQTTRLNLSESFNSGHINVINPSSSNSWSWALATTQSQTYLPTTYTLNNINNNSALGHLIRHNTSGVTDKIIGYDIDLRFPYEKTISLNATDTPISNGGTATNGILGSPVYTGQWSFTTLDDDDYEALTDGIAANTSSPPFNRGIHFTGLSNGDRPAFLVDFGEEGVEINSIEMSIQDTTNSLEYAIKGATWNIAYATGSADTYSVDPTQFTTTEVGQLYSSSLSYEASPSRVLEDAPFTHEGLAWKNIPKVKKLVIYAEPITLPDILDYGYINELKINGISYVYPNGINRLDHIRVRTNSQNSSADWYAAYNTTNNNFQWASALGPFNIEDNGNINDASSKIIFPQSTQNDDTNFYRIRFYKYLEGFSNAEGIKDIELHQRLLPEYGLPDFGFNDSVLETKAWNSSRYDGRQLSAKKLNVISSDDIGNNNKTPIIRNYTRNIYIGNEIIGMSELSPEDPTLVQFPDFSYAQINSYITVNEDGTITNNVINPEENTEDQKRAFYRPFVYDLAEGSFCNFILGDPTVKNNLKSKYPIYFNGGQLKKLTQIQPNVSAQGVDNGLLMTSASFVDPTDPNDASDVANIIAGTTYTVDDPTQGTLYLQGLDESDVTPNTLGKITTQYTSSAYNQDLYRDIYTGSIVDSNNKILLGELQNFINTLNTKRKTSSYKNDKRLFITACQFFSKEDIENPEKGNGRPLYLFEDMGIEFLAGGDYGFGGGNQDAYKKQGSAIPKLSTLGTYEIGTPNTVLLPISPGLANGQLPRGLKILFNKNNSPQQTYYAGASFWFNGFLPFSATANTLGFGKNLDAGINPGSIVLSLNEDDVPSILVPLKKETDLPSGGKGEKPFVIIPENLHPYVKDNLIFYLSKAGIDIGDNATDKVEENTSKKLGAKRILTEAQLKELARRRREARLSRTRRGRRQLRQEERQNRREERREERRENRNERLKERNNRRENRRVDKENRKENRQENRQNRREKRKNRRRRR